MKSRTSRGLSRQQLLAELEDLRARLAGAEETLRAIHEGDVDAIVVSGSKGEQVFSLTGTESVYRLIVESMKEAALTVSLEGRILFCNDQFRQLVKEAPERIVGHPLTDFVATDQKDTATALLRKSRRRSVKQRLVFQDAGGIPVPARIAAHVLNQPDGSSICIVATDLTEIEASTETLRQLRRQGEALQEAHERLQAQAEELRATNEELQAQQEELQSQARELREAEQALRGLNEELEQRVAVRTADLSKAQEELCQAGAYNRSLIEACLDPLVTIGRDGKITDVNAATEYVTGCTRQELIGTDFSDYFTEPVQARAGYQQAFRDGFVRDYPLEIRHRDGRVTPVLYNATVYRDEAGDILGVFAAARDVTELRRAEQAVRAERQQFNDVLETLPAYLVLLTPDHRVPFANRFFRERFGESHGRRCFEHLFGRTEPCETCEAYTVLKTNQPHHWEWTGPDGRNYDVYDFPFTDTDGAPLIMEMGIDRTERKRAAEALKLANETLEQRVAERTQAVQQANERLQAQSEELAAANEELQTQSEQLQESEQRLRLALEGGGMGHWEVDLEKRSVSWCERSSELLGLPSVTLASSGTFLRCVHPEDRAAVEALAARTLAEPADFQVDFRVVHYQPEGRGVILWLSSRGRVIRDAAGRGVRMIGVLYDITPRKEMEEQLRRMNDRLEEEVVAQTEELRDSIDRLQDEVVRRVLAEGKLRKRSQMLEAFFQHTIAPLAFLDKHFNFVRVNEAYAQAEGQTPEYFTKKNYFALHPDEEHRALFEQVVRTGQPYHAYAQPLRPKPPGRGASYCNWQLTPLRDERGQLQSLVFSLEDVTERQKAFQELEQRARQLQKLTLELSMAEDRERRRLAEILHDDLQQQLAAAKFHLGILAGHVRDNPALHETAGQVNQMLKEAIGKSRSLSHELSPPVLYQSDLGETFEWLARQVQTKHGLTVHVEVRGRVDSPSEALKAFLYKAAQELLFNVVKHARTRETRLRVQRVRDQLWLTIGDRGQGFEPQTLSKTTGFGLLSIRERVELLGGRMKIKSAKGRGSTFLIAVPDSPVPPAPTLPGLDEAPTGVEAAAPQKAARDSDSDTPCLRVLLADDHEVMREGLAVLLGEHRDIEIVGQAGNGREAVDLACRLRPDVVVMDAAMPVMPGDDATRLIKQRLPATRVVALSMFAEPEIAEKMCRAGAEIFLLKTAPTDHLLAAIRGGQKRD